MPVEIFCCYSRKDQQLLINLKTHLMPLQRQGIITLWADTDISAGTEWEREINKHLNTAQIILLLISPDFMNSDYCYSKEMTRAIERHEQGAARVIPIILRPVLWQGAPFGKLQALPTDAKPVTDPDWHNLDRALFNVTEGIRTVVVQLGPKPLSPSEVLPSQAPKREPADVSPTALVPQPAKPPSSLKPEAVSLLNTLSGHTARVQSVALSPDGQTLASGSKDQTIKLWKLASGKELRTLRILNIGFFDRWFDDPVLSVVISPDGQTVASGSNSGTIKLWNLATGQELRTLTGHTFYVLSVALSPDGQTVASGSGDGTIKLWNLATGQELRTLTGHTDAVRSVAFSPDGQTLASADGAIKIWGKK